MKRLKTLLLSFATLVVVVLGFFFPTMLSALQDGGHATEPRRYPVETTRLDAVTPAQLSDLLKLVSNASQTMELESGNVRSAQEAAEAAREVLAFMEAQGILSQAQAYEAYRQTPILLFTQDGEEAAVVWVCTLTDTSRGSRATIYIDDVSGKMLSCDVLSTETVPSYGITSASELLAERWAELARAYYGFSSVEVKAQPRKDAMLQYELSFRHADEESLPLPLHIQYFNNSTHGEGELPDDTLRTIVFFNGSL